MKERPILFSAPMVRAILADIKTQTRRTIKGDLDDEERLHVGMYHPTVIDRQGDEQPGPEVFGAWTTNGEWAMKCPYGQPGDRLPCYHCNHDYQTCSEADSSVTERRLHGGVGWADIQPHKVQRVWAQRTGGLVSIEGAHDAQGVSDHFDVAPKSQGHKVGSSPGVHGISRGSGSGNDGSQALERRSIRQQAAELALGNGPRELAGQEGAWHSDLRRETLGGEVHGRGAGAHPVGDSQRLVQPTSRSACSRCGAGINSGHRVGGDRLYVRETWAAPHAYDHLPPRLIPTDARIHYAATEDRGGLLWRPSIHMPRWASRITLEVTGVKVERLQDISEADCQAEGIESYALNGRKPTDGDGSLHLPAGYYRYLWESINGPGSWEANPWVWCVSFKRLEAA